MEPEPALGDGAITPGFIPCRHALQVEQGRPKARVALIVKVEQEPPADASGATH